MVRKCDFFSWLDMVNKSENWVWIMVLFCPVCIGLLVVSSNSFSRCSTLYELGALEVASLCQQDLTKWNNFDIVSVSCCNPESHRAMDIYNDSQCMAPGSTIILITWSLSLHTMKAGWGRYIICLRVWLYVQDRWEEPEIYSTPSFFCSDRYKTGNGHQATTVYAWINETLN